MKHCSHCGELFNENELFEIDGELFCRECAEVSHFKCTECGRWFRFEDEQPIYDSDGNYVYSCCPECATNYYSWCESCMRYVDHELTSINDDEYYVCDHCLNNGYYYQCDECGYWYDEYNSVYDDDLGMMVCYECQSKLSLIGKYHSHDSLAYFGADKPNFKGLGFELEIDCNYETKNENERELVQTLCKMFGNHIYFEHDGSLNYGFEIISNPHTVESFYKVDWASMLETIKEHGYLSHYAKTCGLHIHISRLMFGRTMDEQQRALAKVVYFYEQFYDEILKISRRTKSQANEWAAKYCTNQVELLPIFDALKGKYGRYHAVNFNPNKTIEFRLCRGTLKPESFYAWIDFTLNLVDKATKLTWEECQQAAKWLEGLKPSTIEYIQSRRAFSEVL